MVPMWVRLSVPMTLLIPARLLDGGGGESELGADLSVAESAGHQCKHILFPVRQIPTPTGVEPIPRRGAATQHTRGAGVKGRDGCSDVTNRSEDQDPIPPDPAQLPDDRIGICPEADTDDGQLGCTGIAAQYLVDLVDELVSEDDVPCAGVQHSSVQGIGELLCRVGEERGPPSGRPMQRGGYGLPVRRVQDL